MKKVLVLADPEDYIKARVLEGKGFEIAYVTPRTISHTPNVIRTEQNINAVAVFSGGYYSDLRISVEQCYSGVKLELVRAGRERQSKADADAGWQEILLDASTEKINARLQTIRGS